MGALLTALGGPEEGRDLRLKKRCLLWAWISFIFTCAFIVINVFAKGSIPALGTWFFLVWQSKDMLYYGNLIRWDTNHTIGTAKNFRLATGLSIFCKALLLIILSIEVSTCNKISDDEAAQIIRCKSGFEDNLFDPQAAAECTLLVKQTDVSGLFNGACTFMIDNTSLASFIVAIEYIYLILDGIKDCLTYVIAYYLVLRTESLFLEGLPTSSKKR